MGWDRGVNWKFDVFAFGKRIAKEKTLAEKFKAIAATPFMTIAQLKARFPVREYVERILKLTVAADNQTKCPFHDGKTNTSLVVDPERGIWTCFGGWQPEDGQEQLTGDVINAHQRAFNLATLREAKQSL